MEVSFSIGYERTQIRTVIKNDEIETLTQREWSSLFLRSTKSHIPYFVVAAFFFKNDSEIRTNFYDGVSAYKYLKSSKLDPLTRTEILRAHYIFLNAYTYIEVEENEGFYLTMPLLPLSFPEYDELPFLQSFIEDQSLSSLLFDSLNAAPVEEGAKTSIAQLAKTQFVIGQAIIKESRNQANELEEEVALSNFQSGLKWIWCAAFHGINVAQRTLGVYLLEPSLTNSIKPCLSSSNFEEAKFWLSSSAEQGDQTAKNLLQTYFTEDQESTLN